MTNFLAKARSNRLIALAQHEKGAVMFFPNACVDASGSMTDVSTRVVMAQIAKPMFVRSHHC
ncbi:hypothetical protein [Celeribacter marinus]|uniref:hypothetical protein n=1 Tax=Celeribacter marinus TaxID=1397108 RepID=UPI003F6B978F